LLCQITDRDVTEEIDENIERLDNICGHHGLINGCQLSHSAYTMKTMLLIKPDTFQQALDRLEEIYPKQLSVLKDCKTHPFIEQTVNQMATLYKVTGKEAESEEMYK
jgi:hypothetical protein